MVTRQSAGILLYRLNPYPQVFLVHPGGPYWRNKSNGSWTIPKGEFTAEEPALDAAIREFREETGVEFRDETGVRPEAHFQPLRPIRQKGGKTVYAWAIEGDLDPEKLVSNTFELEWPRGSGRMRTFPEVDKGDWYSFEMARLVINSAQTGFLDELSAILSTQTTSK